MLQDVFGFTPDGAFLRHGSQRVAICETENAATHGVLDHLALIVPDLDATLAAMMARGATLAPNTPDGPQEIAEFWGAGMRYVFLNGPGGALIELCARHATPVAATGHDHIGIPCTDIAATAAFFMNLGCMPQASFTLTRAAGTTPVQFLELHGSVVELYAPPDLRSGAVKLPTRPGHWHRLLIDGISGDHAGPDGILVSGLTAP